MTERPNESAATADFEFSALREANNYRHAIIREFSPWLAGRVLEIGAGIGQISELLATLPEIKTLWAVEPHPGFCQEFRARLPGVHLVQGTMTQVPPGMRWDALLSINVLEHIRDDEVELQNYHRLLQPVGGHILLFVPACPEIYAPLDRDFGHHRRYVKRELRQKLERAGFKIIRLRYFNFVGYFAWWTYFCLLKRRKLDNHSVRLFDRALFPFINALESKILSPPLGQSLLAIAQAGGTVK